MSLPLLEGCRLRAALKEAAPAKRLTKLMQMQMCVGTLEKIHINILTTVFVCVNLNLMAQLSSDQWLYLHQCLEAKWINGSTWGVHPPLGKQKLTNHQLGMSHVASGCQVWIYRDCNLGCTFSCRCHLCGALQESIIPNVSDIKCHTKNNLLQNTSPYQTVLGDFQNFF